MPMALSTGWLRAKCFSSESTERRPAAVYTGQSMKRVEAPRLLTGQGMFLDDITFPGMLHAAVLRSPHAHAHITSLDTAAATRSARAPMLLRRMWRSLRSLKRREQYAC